jgi:hypothetical protein
VAVIEQGPDDTKVALQGVPTPPGWDSVQTPSVVETKVTGKPEEADGDKTIGDTDADCVPGLLKVMDCGLIGVTELEAAEGTLVRAEALVAVTVKV